MIHRVSNSAHRSHQVLPKMPKVSALVYTRGLIVSDKIMKPTLVVGNHDPLMNHTAITFGTFGDHLASE